ncbi:M23 family metallopeptidase [Nonomuraea terrae]|uniref:M23 family metallopeptidase n=1 Tax=Nonomuraea terrae TaxID=2530383 RepID=A0A4R4YV04_9ACTN|nr:M23 family metallopeptidase [Nonomuraea terrae]TDD49153.1 M23 family metallopeptidase [Nonomuraea terrae]
MKLSGAMAAGLALLLTLATAPAAAADPQPQPQPEQAQDPIQTLATNFQLPFPCGQSWTGNSSASSAHQSYEIDFNRGSTADADLGDPVVAAAAGTVAISAHQGSTNGFGNLVKIDHGGGWSTYYAHLNTRSVSAGQSVSQGQRIGTLGNTSRPGNNISPHLHYEVRLGSSYPSNIQRAVFNGVTFGYPQQTLTSRNCGGSANPYTPEQVCGSGYNVIDSAGLTGGTVYLLYNTGNGNNCVVTLKSTSVGTASAVSAYLEVQGSTRRTDSGNFGYYAGPVTAQAASTCVKWGGSAGSSRYDSPFEHCG